MFIVHTLYNYAKKVVKLTAYINKCSLQDKIQLNKLYTKPIWHVGVDKVVHAVFTTGA